MKRLHLGDDIHLPPALDITIGHYLCVDESEAAILFAVLGLCQHQFTAGRSSPAVRGAIQGIILILSLAIVAAAVAL